MCYNNVIKDMTEVANLTLRKLVGESPGFPHGMQAPEVA
jgi:hypothetical protein